MTSRDAFADVAQAIRAGHLRLGRSKELGAYDRRVFDALVDCIFSYSRLSDTTTATQIATWVYDIDAERVAGWHRKKVLASLRELHKAGVVEINSEGGRPLKDFENRIYVDLPFVESAPGIGSRCSDSAREDRHENGTRSQAPQRRKRDPISRETGPDPSRNGTHTGWRTEKASEKTSEDDPNQAQARRIQERIRSSAQPWERQRAETITFERILSLIEKFPGAPDEMISGHALGQPTGIGDYRREKVAS